MHNIIDSIFIFGAKYLYLFVIAIALTWFLIQAKPKKKEILIFAGVCLPLGFIIFKVAEQLYYNPRPFVVEHFIPLIHHAADNGFPSHHTFLVSIVAAIVFVFSRRLGAVLWALVLGVGFSRVYAGVHHIIDVAGSVLISIVSAILVYYFIRYLRR